MKLFKKVKSNISEILLTLYLSVVWGIYSYNTKRFPPLQLLIIVCASTIILFFIVKKILKKLEKFEITRTASISSKQKLTVFVISSISTLLIILIWYWAYFPGCFLSDPISQLRQVISGEYNDWHPAWHTICFFMIPFKLTGNVASLTIFQGIIFSLVLGYSSLLIYKYSNTKWVIVTFIYIMANPYTGVILMYPLKDVGFAMFGMLSLTMVADIILSKKLDSKLWQMIILGFVLVCATLYRHNGILFTAVLIFVLIFNIPKKQFLQLLSSFLIILVLIKFPLYGLLGVEKPNNRITETVGLPLNIIANVAKESPEALDEETSEFIYSIATKESWEKYYQCGELNGVKFSREIEFFDTSVIEEAGYFKILRMTISCFKSNPTASLDALFSLTDILYQLDGPFKSNLFTTIHPNDLGIVASGNQSIANFLEGYDNLILSESILRYIFRIGLTIVLVLLGACVQLKRFKLKSLKKLLFCLPMLAYDFGTMLLLSTNMDTRFFYINYLVCPIILLILFFKSKNCENEDCKHEDCEDTVSSKVEKICS